MNKFNVVMYVRGERHERGTFEGADPSSFKFRLHEAVGKAVSEIMRMDVQGLVVVEMIGSGFVKSILEVRVNANDFDNYLKGYRV